MKLLPRFLNNPWKVLPRVLLSGKAVKPSTPAPVRPLAAAQIQGLVIDSAEEIADFQERTEKLRTAFKAADTSERRSQLIREAFNGEGMNYLKDKYFQNLVNCLADDALSGDYLKTRNLMDSYIRKGSNIMMGVFHVPYANTELKEGPSFEAKTFTRADLDITYARDHDPAEAMLISDTIWSTKGFQPPENFVAHFPEHWCTSQPNDPHALAIYNMDRFVLRTTKYTLPVLEDCISPESFSCLRILKNDRRGLIDADCKWLTGHEHFHGQGLLPIALREQNEALREASTTDTSGLVQLNAKEAFKLKGSRETAAFEELRVDLDTVFELFSNRAISNYNSQLAKELILLERLVRYPLQIHPNENFDSITSQVLLNYLFEKEAICLDDNGRLALQEDEVIRKALYQLKSEFDEVEKSISSTLDLSTEDGQKAAKERIQYFIRKWACRHEKNNKELQDKIEDGSFKFRKDYTLHPFYVKAKKVLADRNVETYALSDKRPASTVSLESLVADDLAIYGGKFPAKHMSDSNDLDTHFLTYMSALARQIERFENPDLQLGDAFLAKLAAADWGNLADIKDKKLIALIYQKPYGPRAQSEIAELICENYGDDSGMKVFDNRFISRITRIINAKLKSRKIPGPVMNGAPSLEGHKALDKLVEEGKQELVQWRNDKMKKSKRKLVTGAALAALLGGGGAWLGSAALTSVPEVPVVKAIHAPQERPFNIPPRALGRLDNGKLIIDQKAFDGIDAQKRAVLESILGREIQSRIESGALPKTSPIDQTFKYSVSAIETEVVWRGTPPIIVIPSNWITSKK